MATALAVTAAGALIALVVAGRPRITLGIDGEQVSDATTPTAAALGLVALAGVAAVLLVRRRVRRVIGSVLVGVALGIVGAYLAPADQFGYSVFAIADGTATEPSRSIWVWVGVVGGMLAALGSAAIATRAGRWPDPRRRYQANPPRDGVSTDPWDALDRGEDPTA